MALVILILSIGIQFWAAGLALLQIKRTGRIAAWFLMASALFLMGVRRAISLANSMAMDRITVDPLAESVALVISVMMLAGVWLIRGLFDQLNQVRQLAVHEAERRARAEAELRLSLNIAQETSARLQVSEARLRFISDNLPGGLVYQIDTGTEGRERRFTFISRGVESLHEISVAEALADPSRIYDQVLAEDRPLLVDREQAAIQAMAPFDAEVRIQLPSGKLRWALFASAPRRLSDNRLVWDGIEIDITARKQASDERQRLQNLESLGTIAGGIAHDFNNLLMGVFGNIELAEMDMVPDHAAVGALRSARQALENAKQLTTRLLTFAKGGDPVLATVDIRQRIQDVVRFNLTGSRVAVRFEIPDDLWPVKADAGQFAQVISNLVINAKDAMPSGGNLRVLAANVSALDAPHLPGDFVKLCVIDEGVGIPAAIIGRIFEPYFTTKSGGSGLGLAITYGIVNKHKGHIHVDSSPNRGTTVTVHIPIDTDARALALREPPASPPLAAPMSVRAWRAGRVLLMDDEAVVRLVTVRMLERLGYTVTPAVEGGEAVAMYEAALRGRDPFILSILDLTVPGGMGGLDAIRRILALDPAAKVIVSSGYASDPVLADSAAHGFSGSLTKPFQLQDLERELTRVVARTAVPH